MTRTDQRLLSRVRQRPRNQRGSGSAACSFSDEADQDACTRRERRRLCAVGAQLMNKASGFQTRVLAGPGARTGPEAATPSTHTVK